MIFLFKRAALAHEIMAASTKLFFKFSADRLERNAFVRPEYEDFGIQIGVRRWFPYESPIDKDPAIADQTTSRRRVAIP